MLKALSLAVHRLQRGPRGFSSSARPALQPRGRRLAPRRPELTALQTGASTASAPA